MAKPKKKKIDLRTISSKSNAAKGRAALAEKKKEAIRAYIKIGSKKREENNFESDTDETETNLNEPDVAEQVLEPKQEIEEEVPELEQIETEEIEPKQESDESETEEIEEQDSEETDEEFELTLEDFELLKNRIKTVEPVIHEVKINNTKPVELVVEKASIDYKKKYEELQNQVKPIQNSFQVTEKWRNQKKLEYLENVYKNK